MQLPKTHVLACLKEHRTSPGVLGAGRAVTARQELWDDRDEEHIGRGMHSWMDGGADVVKFQIGRAHV